MHRYIYYPTERCRVPSGVLTMNMSSECYSQILQPKGWVACRATARADIDERRRVGQFMEALLTIFSSIILQKKGVIFPPFWYWVPEDEKVVNDYFHTLQEANWYYHRHRGDGSSAARFVYSHKTGGPSGPHLRVWWTGWATEGRWVQVEAHDHMSCLSWDTGTGKPSRFLSEAFRPLFNDDVSTLIDDWGGNVAHPCKE